MPGITIHDASADGQCLAFDLRELLDVIQDWLPISCWRVRSLECTGDSAAVLHAFSDTDAELDGIRLRRLADGVVQTIAGELIGVLNGSPRDQIVIRAVDSPCFDVECTDSEVLARYRTRFRLVEEFPPGVTYLNAK